MNWHSRLMDACGYVPRGGEDGWGVSAAVPFSVTPIGRNGLAPLRTGRSLPGDKIPHQVDLFSLPHPIRDQSLKRTLGNRIALGLTSQPVCLWGQRRTPRLTSCPTPSSPPSSDRRKTRGQPAPRYRRRLRGSSVCFPVGSMLCEHRCPLRPVAARPTTASV